MRRLGALMVVLAGMLMGVRRAVALGHTVRLRSSLCRMLEGMRYELGRFRTPLPELFSALSVPWDGEAAALCRRAAEMLTAGQMSFSALWEDALAPLPAREREILQPLGNILGRYGTEEQLAALERCVREMENALQEGQTRLRERSGVCVGLWTAAGLMAAVVLI